MRFEHLTLLTLGGELGPLVSEGEGRFADEREDDLRLIAFVDVLLDPIPLADACGGQWVDGVAQVGHRGLAHLVLVRDGRDGELTRLLLRDREGGNLGFLRVRLAVDAVPAESMSGVKQRECVLHTQWSMPESLRAGTV